MNASPALSPRSKEAMPAPRFYSNVIGSRILSHFVGAPIADSQSGFRLIRTDLLRQVRLTGTGYEIETEMIIKQQPKELDRKPLISEKYRMSLGGLLLVDANDVYFGNM